MINKTNQFNLTTRRMTEAECIELIDRADPQPRVAGQGAGNVDEVRAIRREGKVTILDVRRSRDKRTRGRDSKPHGLRRRWRKRP